MSSTLQCKVANKIKEFGISASLLEKRAKLTRGVISNIIRGTNKNPTAETLIALSRTLGCTIDELVDEAQHSDRVSNSEEFDATLFAEAAYTFQKIIAPFNKTVPFDKAAASIEEIYNYSKKRNLSSVDMYFAEWLIKKL